jgi:fructose transport system substrate-binding protein
MINRFACRRRSHRAALVAAAAAVLTATAGVGSSHASTAVRPQATQIVVGLITKTDTNPFFVKMRQGAQAEANAKGVKLLTAAGQYDGDNQTQVTAIQNFVNEGVKGILLVPSSTTAIVPTIAAARKKGVVIIALDTPTNPQSAVDALFATNNLTAGTLIGKYARAVEGSKPVQIATMDLAPGITVGDLRHNGFVQGYGTLGGGSSVVCSQYTQGDQAKGQTAMETCLQKDPSINLVYTINEPAAFGAYRALTAAGKQKQALVVSVDGGCAGVRGIQSGQIAATSQQYPLKMAKLGVDAIVSYAKTGKKPSGYTDTGVTLITNKPVAGVPSQNAAYGLAHCWG